MTARHTDPETSHEAAASIEPHVSRIQSEVLNTITRYGVVTDQDLIRLLPHLSPSSARTRRKELQRKGLVEWTGGYGRTASGRRARLWRVTQ